MERSVSFSVHASSCGCFGLFRDTTSRLTAIVFRNLGPLCLSCRCFCNQNMGHSTTDPKTLSSSARCHFNLAHVFSLSLMFFSFLFSPLGFRSPSSICCSAMLLTSRYPNR